MPIRSARHRVLLAALLLRAGEVVTVDELAEAVWGERLPARPRKTVQTYVARLRQLLRGPMLIQSHPDGYVMQVARGDVDVGRFELLLAQARDAAGAGDRGAEARALREALALWRGEPLADVASSTLHRDMVARLAEQRHEALQRRIEADLALGRHAEVVSELRALTEQYPLREQYWTLFMTALYRCGRQAEALEAYRRVSRRLTQELGVDPGPELRALHQAVLTHDPALAAPPGPAHTWPRPSQLPPDVTDLVGRADLVDQLERLFADDPGVPIAAVSGPPGVGKTALAVHVAHRLVERYPDGQLFVNLHGATAGLQPLAPLEVLGRFLRALGADPVAIPTDLEEATGLFRSRVAGRRLLVILDNAADAAQVAPLLPAARGCGVLVTSRRVLAALDGAHQVHLDVLPTGDAVELLGRLIDQERVAANPEDVADVARLCGWLPLALRIAGGRLAARPGWPVGALAARLADAWRRLDELELAEVSVRASLAVSYEQLRTSDDPVDRAAAEAFGLLGVLDSPDVGAPVVARLLDVPQHAAERVLERLVDAHLLGSPSHTRYRLHDLLRLYARELAHQHPAPTRVAALVRALGFYVASAWETLRVLRPGDYRLTRIDQRWSTGGLRFADEQAALTWLEAERANLLAAVRQATTSDVPTEIVTQLAPALFGFFLARNYLQDWEQINHAALAVAQRVGDGAAEAQALNDLGNAQWRQGRYDEALASLERSLATYRELDDRRGQAASLGNLGNVHERLGRYQEALASHEQSLAISQELGDRRGRALSLGNLGSVYERLGRHDQALARLQEELAIYRELGDRRGRALSLGNLGTVYEWQGRYQEALTSLWESLMISMALGNRLDQAFSLNKLGIVYQRQGRDDKALECLQEALAIRRELGDAYGQAESLREIGVTLRALGRLEEARAHLQQALASFEQLHSSDADRVRRLLADLHRATATGRRGPATRP